MYQFVQYLYTWKAASLTTISLKKSSKQKANLHQTRWSKNPMNIQTKYKLFPFEGYTLKGACRERERKRKIECLFFWFSSFLNIRFSVHSVEFLLYSSYLEYLLVVVIQNIFFDKEFVSPTLCLFSNKLFFIKYYK